MAEITLTLTLEQLKHLLVQQKDILIEHLACNTAHYNSESGDGRIYTLPIDKEKFREVGMKSKFPNDFNVLTKYLKEE